MLTISATLMALAGASRFCTMFALDAFPVSTVIGGVVEIAVCLFLPWHRYLLRQTNARALRARGLLAVASPQEPIQALRRQANEPRKVLLCRTLNYLRIAFFKELILDLCAV